MPHAENVAGVTARAAQSATASKFPRDSIQDITKPGIRRLARRGCVKRISAKHAKRKTVTSLDVVYALKTQGRLLYGFSG
ncbi:histone [Blastomyces silverae]|uniref:Histone n=1 Tax=Blastomyces silverae TaxID=2060906 RepID=A0A0H1BMM8_9EURO|nr:histone [Blastomyces silverae]